MDGPAEKAGMHLPATTVTPPNESMLSQLRAGREQAKSDQGTGQLQVRLSIAT